MTSHSVAQDTSPARDAAPDRPAGEGREGPVREKFEETRIDEQHRRTLETNAASMKEVPDSADGRGRLRKKRSHDDLDDGEDMSETKHTRKRSREIEEKQRPTKKEKADTAAVEDTSESTQAPAISDEVSHNVAKTQEPLAKEPAEAAINEEPKSKQETTEPFTPAKVSANSGFANASTKSPFASLNATKSPFSGSSVPANGEAFAPSGFSSFAKSSASPFGALSPSKKSDSTEKTQPVEARKEKLSFSASANQPSGFGALGSQKASAFGGALSSASPFASAAPTGSPSPLKSFASSANGTVSNGLSAAKLSKFGDETTEDDKGEDEEDGDEAHQVGTQSEEKQDDRFYQQEVETGEEGEETVFQHRAKLYYKPGDSWKERGVGVFKVNCRRVKVDADDGDEGGGADIEAGQPTKEKVAARFVFRADGNLRTMLNSPVTTDVTFTERAGNEKSKIFTGYIDGRPTPCLIQMKLPTVLAELIQVVDAIKENL